MDKIEILNDLAMIHTAISTWEDDPEEVPYFVLSAIEEILRKCGRESLIE